MAAPPPILILPFALLLAPVYADSHAARRGLTRPTCIILLLLCFSLQALGQSYSIDWYKISGGGGTSTNGTYQVTGTIGQPEASSTMSGGNYSLTGGFWSLISVVQTAGLPKLTITHGGNTVTVSWPDTSTNSYTLQQNVNLTVPAGWAPSSYAISTNNGTCSITIPSPAGNWFFRLSKP